MSSAVLKPIDIYNALNEDEKDEIRKVLMKGQKPCERLGHNYKLQVTTVNWLIRGTSTRLFCSRCGDEKKI